MCLQQGCRENKDPEKWKWFCCDEIDFAVSEIDFCRDEIDFAVLKLILPWVKRLFRDSCGPP